MSCNIQVVEKKKLFYKIIFALEYVIKIEVTLVLLIATQTQYIREKAIISRE